MYSGTTQIQMSAEYVEIGDTFLRSDWDELCSWTRKSGCLFCFRVIGLQVERQCQHTLLPHATDVLAGLTSDRFAVDKGQHLRETSAWRSC